jgi:uncharacterized protein (DUF433 family)
MAQDRYPIPNLPVWQNPDRMSGALCFDQTRVPVRALFENLQNGVTLDEFLDDFEGVTREQAIAVLQHAQQQLVPAECEGAV